MFGDTETSTDLFAAIPATIGDPFLYVETGGPPDRPGLDRWTAGPCGRPTRAIEVVDPLGYGRKDAAARRDAADRRRASRSRAARWPTSSVREAIVPWQFPTALADVLRARRHQR